jgi:FAD-dependent urate hydroxylase
MVTLKAADQPSRVGSSVRRAPRRPADLPKLAAVIGAGPYGLSAAAHLAARGIEVRCFGSPMAGWTDFMPKGMFLKSTAPATSISSPAKGSTLGNYCDTVGLERYDRGGGEIPIPLADFVAYGKWFQERNVPTVERVNVTKVVPLGEGYELLLDTGETVTAGAVIVASGVAPFAYSPPELRQTDSESIAGNGRISHSSEHTDLGSFKNEKVAVIGAGQSAIESAVLLHEAGAEVDLLARAPSLLWNPTPTGRPPTLFEAVRHPPSPLGAGWPNWLVSRYANRFALLPDETRLRIVATMLGPAGAWWLRGRLTDSIGLHLGCSSMKAHESADAVTIEFADPTGDRSRVIADRLILATGYKVDLSRLGLLDELFVSEIAAIAGSPRLSQTFESSKSGLYFIGLSAAATFGPVMRFVAGCGVAARNVADGVAARLTSR